LMAMVWLVVRVVDVVAAGGAVRAVRGFATGGHAHIRGLAQDLCSSHVRCLKSSAAARGGRVLRRLIAEFEADRVRRRLGL
jgi:hypothetical protein